MALREVNLVPARFVYRRRMVRHITFWCVCLFIALGALAGLYGYQKRFIQARQPMLQSLDQVQMLLAERKSLSKKIRAELQKLNQQRVVLGKITKNRSYCQVLWKLSEIFNDETWLTQLTINSIREKETIIQMRLTGLSFSNAALGNFMSRISGDPQFGDVRLVHATEGSQRITSTGSHKALKLIRFEIESSVANR